MINEGGFILLLDLPDLEMFRALRWIKKLICHMRDSLFYPSVTRRINHPYSAQSVALKQLI